MLILLTILLAFVAASAIIYFFNRRNFEKQLGFENSGFLPETTNLRPLFEPTEEELLAEQGAAHEKLEADARNELEEAEMKQVREFWMRLDAWRKRPDKTEIADLLEAASFDGETFTHAVDAVAGKFHNGEIEGLSTQDLAQMLESHFWLIPAEKRTPGVSYRFQTVLRSLGSAPITR